MDIRDLLNKKLFYIKNKKKYKIYDCFLFFNENDLLEIRLNELANIVDYFVILESKLTFSKKEKPLNFDINRFEKFKHKIIYIENEEYVKSPNPWETEKQQRNKLIRGLNLEYLSIKANENDMVILSDLDEIPKKESILEAFYQLYSNNKKYIKFNLKSFRYALNNEMKTDELWSGPVACLKQNLKTMQDLRKQKDDIFNLNHSGWHYSYIGDAENIINKISAYSHIENNKWPNNDIEFVKNRIIKGQSCLGHEECTFQKIKLNRKNCPQYVLKNKKKYDKIIFRDEKQTIWTQIMSIYNQKICQVKKYTLGLRDKFSKKIN